MENYKNNIKERQEKLQIRNGSIIKDGLISAWVSKEQKQAKHNRQIGWSNIITMGLKYKEMREENSYAWGKIDELNAQITLLKDVNKQLKEQLEEFENKKKEKLKD